VVQTRGTNESLRSRRCVGDDTIYLSLRFSDWGKRSLTAIAMRRGDFPKRQMGDCLGRGVTLKRGPLASFGGGRGGDMSERDGSIG
jgi:hypothetical protein